MHQKVPKALYVVRNRAKGESLLSQNIQLRQNKRKEIA